MAVARARNFNQNIKSTKLTNIELDKIQNRLDELTNKQKNDFNGHESKELMDCYADLRKMSDESLKNDDVAIWTELYRRVDKLADKYLKGLPTDCDSNKLDINLQTLDSSPDVKIYDGRNKPKSLVSHTYLGEPKSPRSENSLFQDASGAPKVKVHASTNESELQNIRIMLPIFSPSFRHA